MGVTDKDLWHEAPEDQGHELVFDHARALDQELAPLHRQNRCHAQFYSNQDEPGLRAGGLDSTHINRRRWAGVTENVIASVIDTAKALIGKSKPKMSVLTEGANWDLQQLARQLDKFLFGMFQHLGVYKVMPEMFRDACIFGKGVVKVSVDEEKADLKLERALVDDILVDEEEVPVGGKPLTLMHVRRVSRKTLCATYPDMEEEIERSLSELMDAGSKFKHVQSEMVLVVDAYYRSQGPDDPGRFIRCVSEGTLEDMEWKHNFFPYVCFDWTTPPTGWYGRGLAQALLGFQIRINELNDFVRRCHDLIAVPRVFVEQSSRTLKPKFTNQIGHVTNYVGRPPTFFTPQALNSETYGRIENLKRSAFEFAGISQMAAQATRPEGIEAAVALRELSDNQSQRFSDQQARYEQAYIDLGELIIALVKDMPTKPKALVSTRFVEDIDWPEADFSKHRFTLRAMPSSILGETPAGKKQTIIEFGQYGIPLSPEEIRRLLDHPDLEQSDMLAKAKLEHIHWTIGQLSNGNWVQPDAFTDLQLGLELINAAYLNAIMGEAEEEVLEGFRQWLQLAQRELERLTQPTPEEMALAAAQAGGGEIPSGNIQETALPGIDPTADTAGTLLPGLVPNV